MGVRFDSRINRETGIPYFQAVKCTQSYPMNARLSTALWCRPSLSCTQVFFREDCKTCLHGFLLFIRCAGRMRLAWVGAWCYLARFAAGEPVCLARQARTALTRRARRHLGTAHFVAFAMQIEGRFLLAEGQPRPVELAGTHKPRYRSG
jgi:hypothetical protein